MKRTSFEDMNCSVAQCLEIVGDWWSLLIIRDIFLGVRRFEALQNGLGISRNILHSRLTTLIEGGVLERVQYEERPPRFEYRLTEKGRDLWGVLTVMRQWGDRWAAPDGPPLQLRHKGCNHICEPTFVCSECSEPVDARAVEVVPGPAFQGRTHE